MASFATFTIWICMVLGLVTACTGRPPGRSPGRQAWLGDEHARPGSTARAADQPRTGLSAAEAEAALQAALAQGPARAADVLVHANRLLAAGGTLDAQRWARVREAVDQVAAAALRALWQRLDPAQPPAAHVALRLALHAAHVGQARDALAWLDRVDQAVGSAGARSTPAMPDAAELAARARSLRTELAARRTVDPAVIAVLLPLSGRFARLGAELRVAIELAGQDDGEARLVFLDTAGSAERAVRGVDEAVHKHRAVAILGPVGERESQAAAARAAELGVPIALLAPASAPGSGGAPEAGIFRLWSSATWEAREAARLAVTTGHTRLAVLAPRDEHGERAAEAFAGEARRLGAELVARGTYDPTSTALEPDIKTFLGLVPAVNARLRSHLRRHGVKDGWKTFSPDVAFELLYIPDEHERAALVASFLPYFNVEVRSQDFMDALMLRRKHQGRVPQVVQLLGSSGWHHPGLILRGGPAVEGALVVDIFSGSDEEDYSREEAAAFAQHFRERTGRNTSVVAAQAYDAAVLILEARRRLGQQPTRARLARELAAAELATGVCGPARMVHGELAREAVLLRVDSGAFVLHEF